jgi:hypothetical protein
LALRDGFCLKVEISISIVIEYWEREVLGYTVQGIAAVKEDEEWEIEGLLRR